MAKSYPRQTSSDALTKPAKHAAEHAPFFEDWDEADKADPDLLCAEMSRLAYADNQTVSEALPRIGFSAVDFIKKNGRGTEGFVASNGAVLILAFRGTESDKFADLISDVETLQSDYLNGKCRVHTGFSKSYQIAQAEIGPWLSQRPKKVFFTGHSLGAALATLAAVDHKPDQLITFGSPLVGDPRFGGLIDARVVRRYVNCCDIVTRVPPARFDSESFFSMFGELGNFAAHGGLQRALDEFFAKGAADGLGRLFARLEITDEFRHVADPIYIDKDGTIAPGFGAAERARDQSAARTTYPSFGQAFWEQLGQVFLKHHGPKFRFPNPFSFFAPRRPEDLGKAVGKIREIGTDLVGLIGENDVPLRDLADHAPINYVSAVARRSRPPSDQAPSLS